MYTVLAGLARYLDRTDQSLADLFWPAGLGAGAKPSAVQPARYGQVEESVRTAYLRLARRPGGWVGLARLRTELSNVPRPALDAALVRMFRQPGISLIPEENQKVLTPADRDAAVEIGDEDKHLIAIEP